MLYTYAYRRRSAVRRHQPTMICALFIGLLVTGCLSRHRDSGATNDITSVAFSDAFRLVNKVQLRTAADDPVANAASLDIYHGRVAIADVVQANVKVFDLATGALLRTLGRAGDGPGEFRHPAALVRTPSGTLVVLDWGRQIVSRWDTTGHLLREAKIPGSWSSMTSLPGGNGALLLGISAAGDSLAHEQARPILHELDENDVIVASYRLFAPPANPLEGSFSTFTAAVLDPVVVSGTYATNVVHFHNRISGREWKATIEAPWYHPPDWSFQIPKQHGGDALRAWITKQIFAYQLFAIDGSTFLTQFQTQESDQTRLWGYVLSDTLGVSHFAVPPGPVQILRVAGDTAWGIEPDTVSGETWLRTYLRTTPTALADN